MIVRKAFQYRLCPTHVQEAAMQATLDRCRELYNAGLEERRDAYRLHSMSVSGAAQQAQLPAIKQLRPEYAELDAQMLQDVLQRLDRAFQGFFRRVKASERAGFPRFKSRGRYDSFTFKQTGWKLKDGRLMLRGIGSLKVRWSRPIEGTIKTVTIHRAIDQWYVSISCAVEIADPVASPDKPAIGIDVGLEHFLTTSDGEHVPNPRHLRVAQEALTVRQQAVSRKRRGSKRRKKARLLLAKAHRKIRNQRRDFHHKAARVLVHQHAVIAMEALRIANLTRRPAPHPAAKGGQIIYLPNGASAKTGLNKSINDASWSQFIAILTYKAEEAGTTIVRVNPAGTSQTCSRCGVICPKALDIRWHHCEHCGCFLQRDVNAARNILTRAGQALQARPA